MRPLLDNPGLDNSPKNYSIAFQLHHKNNSLFKPLLVFIAIMFCLINLGYSQRWMENLGRGVVVTRSSTSTAFVNWRLFGTEDNNIGFNLYRVTGNNAPIKLNSSPITGGTNWEDNSADLSTDNSYFVKAILNGTEQAASASYTLLANTPVQPFYDVPIQNYPGYSVKFIWTGDLDGDGEFDFVFDRQPDDVAATIIIEAYTGKGVFLWRMDCGPNSVNRYNISPGSSAVDIGHGDGITVYDINNDGKAEVMVKTANGVKFADGTVLQNSNNNVQFISVLQGATGKEISRVQIPNDFLSIGPLNGHFGIGYFDGVNPSIIYSAKNRNADKSFNMIVNAFKWSNNALIPSWKYVRDNNGGPDGHNIKIIDVNGDGKDDVVPLGFVLDHTGKLLYSLSPKGVVHGDRFHIGDLDPNRPGIEGYAIQQDNPSGLAWCYFDAKNGTVLKSQTLKNPDGTPQINDLARGCAADMDPRYPGYEFWTFTDGVYNVSGTRTSDALPGSYPNLRIWWDGDVLSECLDNGKFTKWNYEASAETRLLTTRDVLQVGPKTPGLMADIIGDWREEAIYARSDNQALRVYTTPYPSAIRLYTLLHNPAYRNNLTVKGYYQGNMVDYYLGEGMQTPPKPNIILVGGQSATSMTLQENTSGFCSVEGTIDTNHTGFTGAGFANGNVGVGSGINWKVNFPGTGSYTLKFRHANGKVENRPARLLINGAVVVANIDMPTTGAWTTWNEIQVNVSISSGIKDIRLEATSSFGLSNIDYINISGSASPVGVDCGSALRIESNISVDENNAVTVAPNPSRASFSVKVQGTFDYIIRDQAGNVVEKGKGTDQWSAGAKLIQGVYVMEIVSPNKTLQTKLIKY